MLLVPLAKCCPTLTSQLENIISAFKDGQTSVTPATLVSRNAKRKYHLNDKDWAIREAKEEVGLVCKNLKLFNIYSRSQLYYKYPDGNEVYNVTATYICKDYTGLIVVDKSEGKDAKFFSIDDIPKAISPPMKIIIDDFILKYENIIAL